MDEPRHVALPKLYGAPAYARPSVVAANPVSRPVNPDDLPLVAEMTEEDIQALADEMGGVIMAQVAEATVPASHGSGEEAIDGAPRPSDARLPPGEARSRPTLFRQLSERIRGARS